MAVTPNLDVTKFRWIIDASTDSSVLSELSSSNLLSIYMEKDRETQLRICELVNTIEIKDENRDIAKMNFNTIVDILMLEQIQPKLRLKILGFQIGCLYTSPSNSPFELSPLIDSDFKVKVEVKQVKIPESPSTYSQVIDEVYFNSRYVGNRQGAVDKFIDLIIEQKPEIIME